MRPEDLASSPGTQSLLLLLASAVVTGISLGILANVLVHNGRWNGGFTKSGKVFTAVSAVMAAASITATAWFGITTIADIDAAKEANIRAVTSWAAEYGVTVDEDQANDIASVVFSGVNDTVYGVTGPDGEITVRLEEAGGGYSLAQYLGLKPLEITDADDNR